jgi:hypothetical protein
VNLSEDKGLAPLFYGLCLFWGISVQAAEDPGDPFDFCLPRPGHPTVCVVIVPEPEDRQVEIQSLLSHGNLVIILDERDLNELRLCQHKKIAAQQIGYWIRTGRTSAAAERHRMGITA